MRPYECMAGILIPAAMILACWTAPAHSEPRFVHPLFGLPLEPPEVFGDLDGDGDLDAFGDGLYFENVGTPYAPDFAKPVEGLLWVPGLLFDLDGDGDLDSIGGTEWFENVGTRTEPAFALGVYIPSAARSITITYGLTPRYIPGDIDQDGDADLFASQGGTGFLRNGDAGFTPEPLPPGLDRLDDFEDRIELRALADLDGDGDLDAILNGELPPVRGTFMLRNTGTPREPKFSFEPHVLPGMLRITGFHDFDGDGDLDGIGTYQYYENVGSRSKATFVPMSHDPFSLRGARPGFVDIDGDGDFDSLGGAGPRVRQLLNRGSPLRPRFKFSRKHQSLDLDSVGNDLRPAFGDIDGDGDQDVFAGTRASGSHLFLNTGSARKPAFSPPLAYTHTPAGSSTDLDPTDLDSDGDLDLVFSIDGTLEIHWNTGTTSVPSFSPVASPDIVALSVECTDVDGDGDQDLFTTTAEGVEFLENIGTATDPSFASGVPDPFGLHGLPGSSIEFADIDGDGDADAFVGESFFERVPSETPCPAAPAPSCVSGFEGALLTLKESRPGREKFAFRMRSSAPLDPGLLGDPSRMGNAHLALCVYDEAGERVLDRQAPPGSSRCGIGQCWRTLREGTESRFKSRAGGWGTANAIKLHTTAPATISWTAKNSGPRGAPARHSRAAPALQGSTHVTVQLHSSTGGCLSTALTARASRGARTFRASH